MKLSQLLAQRMYGNGIDIFPKKHKAGEKTSGLVLRLLQNKWLLSSKKEKKKKLEDFSIGKPQKP